MKKLTCPECSGVNVYIVNEDSAAVYRCIRCGTYFEEAEVDIVDHPRYHRTKPPRKWSEDDRF